MKRMVKVLTIIALFAIILSMASTIYATTLNTEITPKGSTVSNSLNSVAGYVLGAVQVVGSAVAVIMLVVLAIKYISAAPGDKAEIKKHAVVYVVGAILLFGASNILKLVADVAGWFE